MKPKLPVPILLAGFLLFSCGQSPAEIPIPETSSPVTADTSEPETDSPVQTEEESMPMPAETEPIPPPETIPPETAPAETLPAPPVIPLMPEELHTNITDPGCAEILLELWELFEPYPDASLYFADETEEFHAGIRENLKYHSASTIKAPYCQHLLASETDLSIKVPFTASTRTSASGFLTPDRIGTSFTVNELIEYTIRHSDNQAYRLLLDTFGAEDYGRYTESIGVPGLALTDGEWASVTPKELSAAMLEICRTGKNNPALIDHMKNTTFNSQIAAGTGYETAHKYGYNGGDDGYHDTAIVYAPGRAYVLTIMTHLEFSPGNDPNALFREAAALADRLHERLFASTGN